MRLDFDRMDDDDNRLLPETTEPVGHEARDEFAGYVDNNEHMLRVLNMHRAEAANVDEELAIVARAAASQAAGLPIATTSLTDHGTNLNDTLAAETMMMPLSSA